MDFTLNRVSASLTKALSALHEGDYVAAGDAARVAIVGLEVLAKREKLAPDDYQTATPLGYETAIGYVFGRTPAIGELITDVGLFVDNDEKFLSEKALEGGHAIANVVAPKALLECGIKTCLAFPIIVLNEHYNV